MRHRRFRFSFEQSQVNARSLINPGLLRLKIAPHDVEQSQTVRAA
jgi:hypothetical protein